MKSLEASFIGSHQINKFLLLYHSQLGNAMELSFISEFFRMLSLQSSHNVWCSYYRAHIQREKVWFFVAVLRSQEHVCFDRTYDVGASIFEFFVPATQEELFLQILSSFEQEGIVSQLIKLDNRAQVSGTL